VGHDLLCLVCLIWKVGGGVNLCVKEGNVCERGSYTCGSVDMRERGYLSLSLAFGRDISLYSCAWDKHICCLSGFGNEVFLSLRKIEFVMFACLLQLKLFLDSLNGILATTITFVARSDSCF
jgi:hypothetical protein